MNVLAIDQGTSATKALVLGPGGAVLGQAAVPVSPTFAADGAVEQDPRELLSSVVSAGRGALAAAGGVEVAAVGLGNQGETVLRWDRRTGEPLGPALSWQDRRAAIVTEQLAAQGERLTAITGLPLDPYFAAPKMTWLNRYGGAAGPLASSTAAALTTVDAWLTHELTGAFVTDAATASRTMLLDLDTVSWSQEACEAFGLSADSMPEVVGCDVDVGETEVFGGSLPVCGLVVDQQAALLAESCFSAGQAKCTYGTGAFILAGAGEQAVRSGSGLAACVGWQVGGHTNYCLDGQVYTAGAAVSWLERLGVIGAPAEIDALCAAADRGSSSLFVPGLAGLGAPFWAPDAKGAWTGLSLATGRSELVWAVVCGIAAQVALLGEAIALDLGRPLERLRVDGGLTRSRALLQAQADLLQVPVEVYPFADATALGVGALARLGAGEAGSIQEAVGNWRPTAVVEPRMASAQARERLERFRAAATAVAGLGG